MLSQSSCNYSFENALTTHGFVTIHYLIHSKNVCQIFPIWKKIYCWDLTALWVFWKDNVTQLIFSWIEFHSLQSFFHIEEQVRRSQTWRVGEGNMDQIGMINWTIGSSEYVVVIKKNFLGADREHFSGNSVYKSHNFRWQPMFEVFFGPRSVVRHLYFVDSHKVLWISLKRLQIFLGSRHTVSFLANSEQSGHPACR